MMKKKHILFATLLIGIIFQANAQNQKPKAPVKKTVITTSKAPTANKPKPAVPKIIEQPIATTIVEEPVVKNQKITFGLIASIQQNSLLVHQNTEGLKATTPFLGIGYWRNSRY